MSIPQNRLLGFATTPAADLPSHPWATDMQAVFSNRNHKATRRALNDYYPCRSISQEMAINSLSYRISVAEGRRTDP